MPREKHFTFTLKAKFQNISTLGFSAVKKFQQISNLLSLEIFFGNFESIDLLKNKNAKFIFKMKAFCNAKVLELHTYFIGLMFQ